MTVTPKKYTTAYCELIFFLFPCQVALDVIEELCYEMGLHRVEALDEYAIFLVTHRGNLAITNEDLNTLIKSTILL